MTPEKILVYEIRDAIAQLAESDRIQVEAIAVTLRNILNEPGGHGAMAFALVGAEAAAVP